MPNIVEFTDEQLAVQVREQNKELYSEIIRRYEQKLGHYLRKFIVQPDELEDVLQEVFIKIYRNLFDFDPSRRFSSWAYRIAHNEAINFIKKNHRGQVSLDDVEWELADEKMDIAGMANMALDKKNVEIALTQIKDNYRTALVLYFFEQKSYEEIADILLVPRSTVGVLIMRGKKMLKDKLSQLYGR